MKKLKNFGKAISRAEAQQCMNGYEKISEAFDKQIMPLLGTSPTGTMQAVETFYKTKYNAFVFDKKLVTRFFKAHVNAKYIMAILGSQPSDDPADNLKENTPTIILVGVTMDKDGRFTSVPLDLPASEHPPQLVMPTFPLDGQIVFI